MSRIRGKDTGPELRLRRALWKEGLRYRLYYPIPGKPDLVFVSAKVAVFVDGCFWHGCPEHSVSPSTNPEFWRKKIRSNIERDRRVNDQLKSKGWIVLRFWEHDVEKKLEKVVAKVKRAVT